MSFATAQAMYDAAEPNWVEDDEYAVPEECWLCYEKLNIKAAIDGIDGHDACIECAKLWCPTCNDWWTVDDYCPHLSEANSWSWPSPYNGWNKRSK